MKYVSWRVSALSVFCALALQACGGGGGGAPQAVVTPSARQDKTSTSGVAVQMSAASGSLLSISGSPAQLGLPANGVVDAGTLKAITGDISVELDIIDTVAFPSNMPGGRYEALANAATGEIGLIENFGLIDITLNQGDTLVELAKGQKASIRIPVLTRSAERPATLPLYRWDPDQYLWVADGQAKLNQADPAQPFYEGEATRVTAWSAGQPVTQTVTIRGCVEATPEVPAAEGDYEVYTEGWNYTGLAWASKSGGNFSLPTKKGGQIKLYVKYRGQQAIEVLSATADTDFTLPQCILATSNYETLRNFDALRSRLAAGLDMAYDALIAIDPNQLTLRDPGLRCQSGTLSDVTLGKAPLVPGQALEADTAYSLSTTFNQCRPQPEGGELADSITAVLQGGSSVGFFYTATDDGTRTTFYSTLNNLQDAGLQLASNGSIAVTIDSATGTEITPKKGATLRNLATGNTLTFTGGAVTRNPGEGQGELTFHKLSFTLNGHSYVIDGGFAANQPLTLDKDGTRLATLLAYRTSVQATGTIDPF